jgi:MAP/microtubule affinity-regulating kinase
LVLEYIEGFSLTKFLERNNKKILSESETKELIIPLIEALHYIHYKNICHRDIKLDNILIDANTNKIKLIDFGFSTHSLSKDKIRNLFCGTPYYMPPEIIQKREYIGTSCDIWSFGVLLYFILCGKYPFRGIYIINKKIIFI